MVVPVSGRADSIFLDAIEEATRRHPARGTKSRRRRTYDIAVRQLQIIEKQQRSLAKSLRRSQVNSCSECGKARDVPPSMMPAIVAASSDITKQIATITASIRDAHKAEKEAMNGLSPDELDAVLRRELVRTAMELDEAQWSVILTEKFGEDVAGLLMKERK